MRPRPRLRTRKRISGQIHALALEHVERRARPQEAHQRARGRGVLRLGGDAGGIRDLLLQLGRQFGELINPGDRPQLGDLLQADLRFAGRDRGADRGRGLFGRRRQLQDDGDLAADGRRGGQHHDQCAHCQFRGSRIY